MGARCHGGWLSIGPPSPCTVRPDDQLHSDHQLGTMRIYTERSGGSIVIRWRAVDWRNRPGLAVGALDGMMYRTAIADADWRSRCLGGRLSHGTGESYPARPPQVPGGNKTGPQAPGVGLRSLSRRPPAGTIPRGLPSTCTGDVQRTRDVRVPIM